MISMHFLNQWGASNYDLEENKSENRKKKTGHFLPGHYLLSLTLKKGYAIQNTGKTPLKRETSFILTQYMCSIFTNSSCENGVTIFILKL